MKKIIFTGAQGTGKTTVLNKFKEGGYPIITEVVRKLAKNGVKINEEGTIDSQKIIFDAYVNEFAKEFDNPYTFSDRGLTDVTAYTAYLANVEHNFDAMSLLLKQLQYIREWNDQNDAVYFYFPIEFDIVDDGVRSMNESYREFIDKYIKFILEYTHTKYYTVRGTVEERVKFIKDHLTS